MLIKLGWRWTRLRIAQDVKKERAIAEGMMCIRPSLIKINHTGLKLDDDDNALFVEQSHLPFGEELLARLEQLWWSS